MPPKALPLLALLLACQPLQARDPMQPLAAAAPGLPPFEAPAAPASAPAMPPTPPLPQLQGLVQGSEGWVAVLDGRSFAAGAHWAGFEVLAVDATSVRLRAGHRHWLLRLYPSMAADAAP